MPSFNKIHTFDEQTLDILSKVPKMEKSAFVREGILLRYKQELNPELKEIPEQSFEVLD